MASFGSFGPAGPGFGSIQNAPATGVNPTAFPTAPPSPGLAPGGLGNMVGVNLQPQQLQNTPAPQPFRSPLPLPPPPAAAAAPAAAPPPSNPFANVQIPQGQNAQIAEPRGGLNIQQWQALTPQQQSSAGGLLSQYQAGNNMPTNPGGSASPAGLAMMNNAASQWNSLFGLGGL
jgi:hypothetical protein